MVRTSMTLRKAHHLLVCSPPLKRQVQLEHEMQDLATKLTVYSFSVFSSHQNIPPPQQISTKRRNQSLSRLYLWHHVSLFPCGCDCLAHSVTKTSACSKAHKTASKGHQNLWNHNAERTSLQSQLCKAVEYLARRSSAGFLQQSHAVCAMCLHSKQTTA